MLLLTGFSALHIEDHATAFEHAFDSCSSKKFRVVLYGEVQEIRLCLQNDVSAAAVAKMVDMSLEEVADLLGGASDTDTAFLAKETVQVLLQLEAALCTGWLHLFLCSFSTTPVVDILNCIWDCLLGTPGVKFLPAFVIVS